MDGHLLRCVLWILVAVAGVIMGCDFSFNFPTLNSPVYSVEKGSNISLPFSVSSTCSMPDNFRISVAKRARGSSFRSVVCQILHNAGKCFETSKALCQCLPEEGKYTYLLTKPVQRGDDTTWIWWKDREQEMGTELVFKIVEQVVTSNPTTGTTGDKDNQHSFFQTENVIILSALAGFIVLTIVAFIIVYAKTGRGILEIQARMRQGPSAENRVLPYADLLFENSTGHHQQAARRVEPYVELIWDSRDQHPKPAERPQRRPRMNPEPLLDPDGYMRPRAMVRM